MFGVGFWDAVSNFPRKIFKQLLKKTRKTPKKEIEKAEALRKEYLKNK